MTMGFLMRVFVDMKRDDGLKGGVDPAMGST